MLEGNTREKLGFKNNKEELRLVARTFQNSLKRKQHFWLSRSLLISDQRITLLHLSNILIKLSTHLVLNPIRRLGIGNSSGIHDYY